MARNERERKKNVLSFFKHPRFLIGAACIVTACFKRRVYIFLLTIREVKMVEILEENV